MLNITLTEDKTVVINTGETTGGQWTLNTVDIFGKVFSTLERDFSGISDSEVNEQIISDIKDNLSGKPQRNNMKYIFNRLERGETYIFLSAFIDGRKVLSPTLKDVENLRIFCHMTVGFLPIIVDGKEGMRFVGLKDVKQVMTAVLYYYAYNEYKLTRCKHCGKWFAVKSLKTEYCNNISPCYKMKVNGTMVLSAELPCAQAVRTIKERLQSRKKTIYDKWCNKPDCSDDCFNCKLPDCIVTERCGELCNKYAELSKKIKEQPSVENILLLHKYLYSDEMPKQTRPNRRKLNEERRRLKEQ